MSESNVVSERNVEVGSVLAGKYRVERVLGQGGMGVVLEATQLDLDRRVALKFLRTEKTAESNVALARFQREAQNIAKLRGDHIVHVFDVGRLEHGEPFIVMELLRGEDLCSVLDREGRIPASAAIDYVLQACEAMAEAHVAGVIHRDLKPANLFLTRRTDGRPLIKVLDFGISKLTTATTSNLGLTTGTVGSPLYMSPEQLQAAKDIDHRTDVWSLGTILYELITGAVAFYGEVIASVCTRILTGRPEPMRAFVPDLPEGLELVVLRCLEKSPAARFPTVADLASALLPFAKRSSMAYAEAAIRIVRGSELDHGILAEGADSVLPHAPFTEFRPQSFPSNDSPTAVGSLPPSFVDVPTTSGVPITIATGTVNISGMPPAAPNQDPKPFVSTAARPAITDNSETRWLSGPRALLLLGLAISIATVAGVAAFSRKSDTEVANPERSSGVTTIPTAIPAPPVQPQSAPAIEPSAGLAFGAASVPLAASSAPVVPAPAVKPQAPKVTKPKPTPPREKPEEAATEAKPPSREDMLKHR